NFPEFPDMPFIPLPRIELPDMRYIDDNIEQARRAFETSEAARNFAAEFDRIRELNDVFSSLYSNSGLLDVVHAVEGMRTQLNGYFDSLVPLINSISLPLPADWRWLEDIRESARVQHAFEAAQLVPAPSMRHKLIEK